MKFERCPESLLPRPYVRAFTMTELLVVVAVIAILMALAFPVFSSAINQSASAKSVSNLQKLGVFINLFAEDNGNSFPPAAAQITDENGRWTYLGAWDSLIMPYMGIDVPRNHPNASSNAHLMAAVGDLYSHPKDRSEIDVARGSGLRRTYAMSTVPGGVGKAHWSGTVKKFSERRGNVPDAAGTILLAERPGVTQNTVGRTGYAGMSRVGDQTAYQEEPLNKGGKFNYLFADGHVESLRIEETLGEAGSLSNPEGMWTVDPND